MARATRPIRLDDEEWADFKTLLGTEWLRARIRGARLAENRRAKAKAEQKLKEMEHGA